MKKIARLLLAASICTALVGTDALAAERGRKEYNTGSRPEQSRPAQSSRPAPKPGGNQKPGGTNHRPGGTTSPSGQRPQPGGNNHRPGGNNRPGGSNQRPGGNDHRPGNGRPDHRPGNGNDHRPGSGRPDHRPGNWQPNHRPGYGPNVSHRPPHRPHMPGGWQHWRPTPPPPAYRPYAAWPRFSTVLGVRFGTSLALTLNSLLNSGYNVVSSYGNTVYLQNVPMLGIYWPEASLSYTGSGRLAGSEFISYSNWADPAIYNRVYSQLCANYGAPYSNTGTSAAWWGPEGQYIRLNFASGIGSDGFNRFYTTLNFGIY